MERFPGVLVPPLTLTHGADDAFTLKFRSCDGELELTVMELGDGTADVPEASANDAVPAESTRSAELGRIVTDIPRVAVAGGDAESAAIRVKLELPATVGVPDSWPLLSVRPAGSEP